MLRDAKTTSIAICNMRLFHLTMRTSKWRASTAPKLLFPHHAIFIAVFVFHISGWVITQKQKNTNEFTMSAAYGRSAMCLFFAFGI